MDWSHDTVLKFIEMYKSRPVLWDNRNSGYKNKNRRNEALTEISDFLHIDKAEIERKIKNLLSHFSRESKKEKLSRISTNGISKYVSKWFAYKSMQFLADRRVRQKRKHSDVEEEQSDSDASIDNTPIVEAVKVELTKPALSDDHSENSESPPTKKQFALPKKSDVTSKQKKKGNSIISEACSIMRQMYSERDEYSVFGEQIAFKLRKLPSEHARITVQHVINTVLYEAELGKYNQPGEHQIFSGLTSDQSAFLPDNSFCPNPAWSLSHSQSPPIIKTSLSPSSSAPPSPS